MVKSSLWCNKKARRRTALLFNLGARWGWVISATLRPLYRQEDWYAFKEAGGDPVSQGRPAYLVGSVGKEAGCEVDHSRPSSG